VTANGSEVFKYLSESTAGGGYVRTDELGRSFEIV